MIPSSIPTQWVLLVFFAMLAAFGLARWYEERASARVTDPLWRVAARVLFLTALFTLLITAFVVLMVRLDRNLMAVGFQSFVGAGVVCAAVWLWVETARNAGTARSIGFRRHWGGLGGGEGGWEVDGGSARTALNLLGAITLSVVGLLLLTPATDAPKPNDKKATGASSAAASASAAPAAPASAAGPPAQSASEAASPSLPPPASAAAASVAPTSSAPPAGSVSATQKIKPKPILPAAPAGASAKIAAPSP
jgi:hypothetical protein